MPIAHESRSERPSNSIQSETSLNGFILGDVIRIVEIIEIKSANLQIHRSSSQNQREGDGEKNAAVGWHQHEHRNLRQKELILKEKRDIARGDHPLERPLAQKRVLRKRFSGQKRLIVNANATTTDSGGNKKAALSGGFDENTLTFDYLRRRSKTNAPMPITPRPITEGSGTTMVKARRLSIRYCAAGEPAGGTT